MAFQHFNFPVDVFQQVFFGRFKYRPDLIHGRFVVLGNGGVSQRFYKFFGG